MVGITTPPMDWRALRSAYSPGRQRRRWIGMVKLRSILTLLCVGACAASGYPVRQSSLKVRLLNALTSYDSQNGSEFRSVVIAPYMRHHRVILPPGTIVLGTVHKARQIGIGMVHERATIELVFHDYVLPDGRQFPFRGTLRRIDNSRETVNDEGKIEGILAANNPQSLIQGIWHRPRLWLLPPSFIGMT